MRNPASRFSYYDETRDPSGISPNDNRIIYSRLRKVENKVSNKGILIKYVIEGEENYRVNHQSYRVRSGEYLIINEGREVLRSLDSEDPVEGLWIHLSRDLIEEVYLEIKSTLPDSEGIRLLDPAGNLELCEHVFKAQESFLGTQLEELGRSVRQHPNTPVREVNSVARKLAEGLVRSQWKVYQQINRLTSAKLSTKKELYRRLSMARSYIHNHLNAPLDLDTLSQVACLSKYHFIRLFKEVYGQTPRQYLIKKRLEQASNLLLNSSKSFHEICLEVGLKDSSSFGRLFKRSYGATPHIYRRTHAAV